MNIEPSKADTVSIGQIGLFITYFSHAIRLIKLFYLFVFSGLDRSRLEKKMVSFTDEVAYETILTKDHFI